MNVITQLHESFNQLVPESAVSLRMDRECAWARWLGYRPEQPFSGKDLEAVVRHLRLAIKMGHRYPGALRFSNLIGQPDYFEEDLALARAAQARLLSPKQQVLQQSGRELSENPPRLAGELAQKALATLRRVTSDHE